jgi:hypothetical protein
MILILTLLLINYLFARLLIKLTFKLSALYVENSQILCPTIEKEMYEIYLKIYKDKNYLDNVLIMHIPIFNLFQCFLAYISILNIEEILKK